jgi:hypothetical protein
MVTDSKIHESLDIWKGEEIDINRKAKCNETAGYIG